MVRLPVKTIERELDRLERDFQCRVDDYALALFNTYVRPFCDRNNVTFHNYNGDCFFCLLSDPDFDCAEEWTVDGMYAAAPKRATWKAPAGWQAILQLDDIPAPLSDGYGLLTRMPDYSPKKGR